MTKELHAKEMCVNNMKKLESKSSEATHLALLSVLKT